MDAQNNEIPNAEASESSNTVQNEPISLKEYFLARLERLVALRAGLEASLKVEPWKKKALNHAIYSTMLDCNEQEVIEEAKLILSGNNHKP